MNFEADIIVEIVFFTELDYCKYTRNATESNLKFHHFLRFSPICVFSPIFDTLFPLILNILEIIQLGKKNYFRYNLSFKIHIGTCESVENCGNYVY